MPVITPPRLLAALAATSLVSATLAALPGLAAGDAATFWPLMGLGATLLLLVVLLIAAIILPLYILLRKSRRSAEDAQFSRSRALGTLTGAAVGTLLGVCAASHGHIAATVVVIVAVCGAILGYADACWREPPQRQGGQATNAVK